MKAADPCSLPSIPLSWLWQLMVVVWKAACNLVVNMDCSIFVKFM